MQQRMTSLAIRESSDKQQCFSGFFVHCPKRSDLSRGLNSDFDQQFLDLDPVLFANMANKASDPRTNIGALLLRMN